MNLFTSIVRRAVLPAVALILGLTAIVYGSFFQHRKVMEEQEEEVTIRIPLPGAFGMGFDDRPRGQPGDDQEFDDDPSNYITKKVKRVNQIWKDELEPVLVRDITIGGLVRLASGELKRTYSGKPPSLCPT